MLLLCFMVLYSIHLFHHLCVLFIHVCVFFMILFVSFYSNTYNNSIVLDVSK